MLENHWNQRSLSSYGYSFWCEWWFESHRTSTDSNSEIRKLSPQLTKNVKTKLDAVQRVVTWIVDNVRYVNQPVQYDALYSFKPGKCNCWTFPHLAAAPLRIIDVVTLKQPFDIALAKKRLILKWGRAGIPGLKHGSLITAGFFMTSKICSFLSPTALSVLRLVWIIMKPEMIYANFVSDSAQI